MAASGRVADRRPQTASAYRSSSPMGQRPLSPLQQAFLHLPPDGNPQQQAYAKNIDKPVRRITEIRVFYDDQTWEAFVPKK